MRSSWRRSKNGRPSRSTSRLTTRSNASTSLRIEACERISVANGLSCQRYTTSESKAVWAGSASEAVSRSASDAYSDRPSSRIARAALEGLDRDRPGEDVLDDPPARRLLVATADRAQVRRGRSCRRRLETSPGSPASASGTTGSIRHDTEADLALPPRWRRISPANGDGQRTGQYDDATRQPDPVPGREAVAGRPQRHDDVVRDAGLERPSARRRESPVGQVEDAGRDLMRRPVRGDVRQADRRASRPASSTTPRAPGLGKPRTSAARPSGAEV